MGDTIDTARNTPRMSTAHKTLFMVVLLLECLRQDKGTVVIWAEILLV